MSLPLTRAGMAARLAATAAAVALLAGPALAQKTAPPPPKGATITTPPTLTLLPTGTILDQGYALCLAAAAGAAAAEAAFIAGGYTVDDSGSYGPFTDYVSGSIENDEGSIYVYATLETYPDATLDFCTFEVDGILEAIDIDGFAYDHELIGPVQSQDDGIYASLNRFTDDTATLVLVEMYEDYLYLQVNYIAATTAAMDAM